MSTVFFGRRLALGFLVAYGVIAADGYQMRV